MLGCTGSSPFSSTSRSLHELTELRVKHPDRNHPMFPPSVHHPLDDSFGPLMTFARLVDFSFRWFVMRRNSTAKQKSSLHRCEKSHAIACAIIQCSIVQSRVSDGGRIDGNCVFCCCCVNFFVKSHNEKHPIFIVLWREFIILWSPPPIVHVCECFAFTLWSYWYDIER